RTLRVNDNRRPIALVELLTVGQPATLDTINDGPAQLSRYQLDNHLGSAVLELDGSGRILSYEEYHPFGTTAYRATDSVLEKNPKRYAFTSKERDQETGLSYHGARYYAPWCARWISADPGGLIDGTNQYSYGHNNPVVFHDPNGMESEA